MACILPRTMGIVLFLTGALMTPTVWAHAHLQQQTPAANTEVSPSPNQLTLDFSEGVEASFSGLTLLDPRGKTVSTEPAVRSESNNKQLIIPLQRSLAPGLYTVKWHVVSVDGHKTKGQYQFSVKE